MRGNQTIGIAAVGMALLCGCEKNEPPPKVLTPVRAATVETAQTAGEKRYSANLIPNTRVDVAFHVGGYVVALHQVSERGRLRALDEGDLVSKGTVVARVRQEDYEVKVQQARSTLAQSVASLGAAKSQLVEAEASLRQAMIDYGRANKLLATESLTRADYDSSVTKLDTAKARTETARSQAEACQRNVLAAEAQVKETEIALRDTELIAAIDGTVLSRTIEVGTLVSPGTVGVTLGETGILKAVFGVPDAIVAHLRRGQSLAIRTDAIPAASFPGRITMIAPAADSKSRLFDVELSVPNPARRLRPGMIATVTIGDPGARGRVPVLPLSAIVPSKTPGQYAVFLLEASGKSNVARMRDVRLGEAIGSAVAVLDGVRPGQLVITNGSTMLNDGEAVQLIP